jgi:OFA family oxalate/formate antiporter-like MFS transporter
VKSPGFLAAVRVVVAAVIVQTLLGSLYAWSVFVPPLRNADGITAAQGQLVFGLMIASFVGAMVPAGRLLEQVGPRWVAGAGALLYGGGYLLAGSGGLAGTVWVLPAVLAGVGLMVGAGVGCGYVSAIACCVRAFPARKGMITGVAVAGFGAGASGFALLASRLVLRGWDVLDVFRLMGLACGPVVFAAAMLLRLFPEIAASAAEGGSSSTADADSPAEVSASHGRSASLLRQRDFITSCVCLFAGTFAGLVVVGNLTPIGVSLRLSEAAAATAVVSFALGNMLGRLAWGWVFDRLPGAALPLNLLLISLGVCALAPSSATASLFAACAFLIAFGFGGCFVLVPAFVAARFGTWAVARVYPLVFLTYGLAALCGPPLGGWIFDRTGSFVGALAIAVGVSGLGAAALLWRLFAGRPAENDGGDACSAAATP